VFNKALAEATVLLDAVAELPVVTPVLMVVVVVTDELLAAPLDD